ncbi:Rap/Ran GTPase activating protein, putative [Entamoeba histolytica HM-1:IMSS-B]|uniref:Rap/Ran GTPase activating protein, putative n=6 Tax=Entamoeba histolytica TaxID=5759 RepID=C4M4N1_ENTH1|nr:Rap/Ran GTPase activating protein, putative [Entamoeba histolytica HM-1:IMSS]EMD47633.1 Rap/Ran GTPase activating protein, putative [Entamoeba histolytica KU27]EMH75050.1 Rap/Ran GTPase activating protein, putative [Entamoeba histolytica HM-1:IMSS-B]EMS15612.1 Rap/Ran GTPase activating protein [Entamoeba histolytica HM-3:IMSS]ENY65366.1 Rap/Ran GTPase activating protein, putative [Entamoeba histolytica HM-1:IMSS-A]GAT96336.1 rap ran GTPase activating protein putative [Entamoeba histolytica]|eukprot:XP_651011.1 Rap/Ran GTPase activating protein, putative [Entamoeba histolytica HM-1:IMSS]
MNSSEPLTIQIERSESVNNQLPDLFQSSNISEQSATVSSRQSLSYEDEVTKLKLEIERLKKEKIEIEESSKIQFMKEFSYYASNFPLCGEQFQSGLVDPSNGNLSFVVLYPKIFEIEPTLFVFKATSHGNGTKITNSIVDRTNDGFTIKLDRPAGKGTLFLWFAYTPLKNSRKEFTEMTKLFHGSVTRSQIEQPMMAYVRKYGPNDSDENGKTLLHYCVQNGLVEMVNWLLAKGAYVNAADKFRYTPLHIALSGQTINANVINALLDSGADKKARNVQHRTPLHYLCRQTNIEQFLPILNRFLPDGENNKEFVNLKSSKGDTALIALCNASMNIDAMKILCKNEADVNVQTMTEDFPLYYAIKKRNKDAIRILLQHHALLNLTFYGKDVMKIAEEYHFELELKDILNSSFLIDKMSELQIKTLQETFETIKYPQEKWLKIVNPDKIALIDISTFPVGYHLENYSNCCSHTHKELEYYNTHDPTLCIKYYEKYFDYKKHINYIVPIQGDVLVVSMTESLLKSSSLSPRFTRESFDLSTQKRKIIIRNKKGDLRKEYPGNITDIQILKELGYNGKTLSPIHSRTLYTALTKLENQTVSEKFKFGVLYGTLGQLTENEFYNNKEASPYFEQFLKLLGERVDMKTYPGYCGGLNCNGFPFGTEIIVSTFSNDQIECAFHVSTMLPFNAKTDQQIERKKIIQNDICVIIFKEYNSIPEPIDITSFKSLTNHAFLIIGYDLSQPFSLTPKYDINLCVKNDVPPIPPFITQEKYHYESALHDFLLAKLINADRLSQSTSFFRGKFLTNRQNQLESICLNAKVQF